MAVTFNWAQSNGAGETVTELAETGNIVNFKAEDSSGTQNWESKSILASDVPDEGRSYEIWLRGHFTGTFNGVSNLRFYMSQDFSPNTGLTVYFGDTDTYATPINTSSGVASSPVPTSIPGSNNVGIGGSLSGELINPGYSDYIVLQLKAGAVTPFGPTSLAEFTIEYEVR